MSREFCVNVLDEEVIWEEEGYRSVMKIISGNETSRNKNISHHSSEPGPLISTRYVLKALKKYIYSYSIAQREQKEGLPKFYDNVTLTFTFRENKSFGTTLIRT